MGGVRGRFKGGRSVGSRGEGGCMGWSRSWSGSRSRTIVQRFHGHRRRFRIVGIFLRVGGFRSIGTVNLRSRGVGRFIRQGLIMGHIGGFGLLHVFRFMFGFGSRFERFD